MHFLVFSWLLTVILIKYIFLSVGSGNDWGVVGGLLGSTEKIEKKKKEINIYLVKNYERELVNFNTLSVHVHGKESI